MSGRTDCPRTFCPPTLYFHRTVWLLCTPTRGTDQGFFNIKILKFCSMVLQIFVYSPVKVKCRRTNCPGSFDNLSGFRLQVSFDNVEIVCGFVPTKMHASQAVRLDRFFTIKACSDHS